MSQGGSTAGVLVAAALHHLSGDWISQGSFPVPRCGQQRRRSRQGQAGGAPVGTPALLRPNKGWSGGSGRQVLPGKGEGEAPGQEDRQPNESFLPTPQGRSEPRRGLAPGFFHLWPQISTYLLLLTPQSWGSQSPTTRMGMAFYFARQDFYIL